MDAFFSAAEWQHDYWTAAFSPLILKSTMFFSTFNYPILKYNLFPTSLYSLAPTSIYSTFLNFSSQVYSGEFLI